MADEQSSPVTAELVVADDITVRHDAETVAALAAADKMLNDMSGSFSDEARRQITSIQKALDAHATAKAEDPFERRYQADLVFEASHELRGQAGSFGYGLLGELCDSLCLLLELEKRLDSSEAKSSNGDGRVWKAVVQHANAVTSIVENDLKGDGGDWGRQLSQEVARLRGVLDHITA